jgi:cysteine desulfurase
MPDRSYFDWNATTPLRPAAREAMAEALAVAGNPSSVHAEGRAARRVVEQAREQVAALVGAKPPDVFFTSSGTEANMLALTPAIETQNENIHRYARAAGLHTRQLRICRLMAKGESISRR